MADCIAERDCVKAPIGEKCRKFCLERVLSTATPEEKRLILGYRSQTANAIYKAYQDHSINNFDDLNVFSESIFRSEANSVLSSSMLNVATMFQTKNDTQNPRRVS